MFDKEELAVFTELLEKDNVLILTHKSPDGDTLGSAFALKKIFEKRGKKAHVRCSDTPSRRYSFLVGDNDFSSCPFSEETVVSVDVATADMLGDDLSFYKDKVDFAIDHHYTNTNYAKKTIVKPDASSVGEVIWALTYESGVEIDSSVAADLYSAIAFDTGCFKFSNVLPETMIAASELLKYKIPSEDINRRLFDISSLEQLKVESALISGVERYCDNKITVLCLTQKLLKDNNAEDEELDGIATIPRRIEGTVVGLTFKETEEGFTKISLRSLDDRIDVAKIAAVFGGGGHKRAAGCLIKELTVAENKERVVSETIKEFNRVFPEGYTE